MITLLLMLTQTRKWYRGINGGDIMENIRKELIRQKRSNEEILKSLDEKELSRSEYLDKVEIEGIIKGLNIALGVLEKCR